MSLNFKGFIKNKFLFLIFIPSIIFDVWNDSRWPHSMHLRGNHFYVESKEFSDNDKLILRDTYLTQPGEKSKFIY